MTKRRVAVTGLGVVSPLGNDVQTTWTNLIAGKSGIDTIKQFDASAFPAWIAAEVKQFQLDPTLVTKSNRIAMSFTAFALEAARQAFQDSGIVPTKANAQR